MATNQVFDFGTLQTLAGIASHPSAVLSGSPAVLGQMPAVALTDEDADGVATFALSGVWDLLVTGEGSGGAAAINNGDILYYDSGIVNKDTGGIRYGYAAEAETTFGQQVVASGAQTTIRVKLGY